MFAIRVVMRPVNNAALSVPFILTVEGDHVSDRDRLDTRREVDVVSNKNGKLRLDLENETLMTTTVVIVGENSRYDAAPGDLIIDSLLLEGLPEIGALRDRRRRNILVFDAIAEDEIIDDEDYRDDEIEPLRRSQRSKESHLLEELPGQSAQSTGARQKVSDVRADELYGLLYDIRR